MRKRKKSDDKNYYYNPFREGYQPIGEPLPTDPEERAKVLKPPKGGTGAVRANYNWDRTAGDKEEQQ